jgi:2-polyprenyl-3-methyl-5-hydroxy-6-metoxy-1,4-benzoquinol methylase
MLLTCPLLPTKVRYFIRSAWLALSSRNVHCPSCGSWNCEIVSRKYLVTTLRRCHSCNLLYRAPLDHIPATEAFYDEGYDQGFTTTLPARETLNLLLNSNFKGTEKDFSRYIEVLRALGARRGMSVLDFGCSWGYGAWQLSQAGYAVSGFEIGRSRARFARDELGVNVLTSLEQVTEPFDVVFSAHVLEHIPALAQVFARLRTVLRKDGLFVAFMPNGEDAYRRRAPDEWRQSWGLVHPTLLDVKFFETSFRSVPRLFASSPFDCTSIETWPRTTKSMKLDLSGSEFLFAFQNTVNPLLASDP